MPLLGNVGRSHFSAQETIYEKCSKDVLDILTNKEVISIDQDSLGIQGFRQSKIDSLEI